MADYDVDAATLRELGSLAMKSALKPEVLAELAALSHNQFRTMKTMMVKVTSEGPAGIPLQATRTGYPVVCGETLLGNIEPGDIMLEINANLVGESVTFAEVQEMMMNERPLNIRFGHPKTTEDKLKYYGSRWRPYRRKLDGGDGGRREPVPVNMVTIEFRERGPLGMRIGESVVDNAIVMDDPIEGTQAQRNGVQIGDVILGVGRHLNLTGRFTKVMHHLSSRKRPLKVLVGRPTTRQAYMDYYGNEHGPPGMKPPEDTDITGPLDDKQLETEIKQHFPSASVARTSESAMPSRPSGSGHGGFLSRFYHSTPHASDSDGRDGGAVSPPPSKLSAMAKGAPKAPPLPGTGGVPMAPPMPSAAGGAAGGRPPRGLPFNAADLKRGSKGLQHGSSSGDGGDDGSGRPFSAADLKGARGGLKNAGSRGPAGLGPLTGGGLGGGGDLQAMLAKRMENLHHITPRASGQARPRFPADGRTLSIRSNVVNRLANMRKHISLEESDSDDEWDEDAAVLATPRGVPINV